MASITKNKLASSCTRSEKAGGFAGARMLGSLFRAALALEVMGAGGVAGASLPRIGHWLNWRTRGC